MWIIFSVDKLVVHQKTFQLNDFRADARRVVAVIQILSKKFFFCVCSLPTSCNSWLSVLRVMRSKSAQLERGTICELSVHF